MAVTALNQIIAVRKGVQSETHAQVTTLHRDMQKPTLLSGLTRTYRKIRDDDADLPGEAQRVQVRTDEVLAQIAALYTKSWNMTAAVDWTNCVARADVVVDGQTLIRDAPVSFLLYLEKQLTNLHSIIDKAVVLDPADQWRWDGNASAWVTAPATTVRTKKEPRNHVLSPATDKHPAQVQVFTEDVPVGYWDTVKFSGALSGERRQQLLARVTALREAVKVAREQANMTDVVLPGPSSQLFAYLLAE